MCIQNLKTLALIEAKKFVTENLLGDKEKWTNKGNEWEMEKSKNGKKKAKLISASWFSFPQYTWALSRCIQNLKTLALIEVEKSVTEIFIGEKEKGQIMGMISRRRLILFYTIQQVIPNICTKFQNPRHSSSWEIWPSLHDPQVNVTRLSHVWQTVCISYFQYKICRNTHFKGVLDLDLQPHPGHELWGQYSWHRSRPSKGSMVQIWMLSDEWLGRYTHFEKL